MITSFNEGTPRKSILTPETLVVCFQPPSVAGAAAAESMPDRAAVAGVFRGFCSGTSTLRAGSSSGNGTDCCCMPAHAICAGIRRDKRRAFKKDLDRIMFAPASYDWQKKLKKGSSPQRSCSQV